MFGKSYTEYLRFQTPFLVALVVMGLARLALSIGGASNDVVKYFSMNVIFLVGTIYYGLRVGRSGFGTYRHLLPLIFNQSLVIHTIAVLGIALSANGFPNVFDAPEFRGPGSTVETTALPHALSHVFIGMTVGTLVSWAVGSLVMLIGGRPNRQAVASAPTS